MTAARKSKITSCGKEKRLNNPGVVDCGPGPRRVGIISVGICLPDRILESESLRQEVAANSGLSLPPGIFERVTGVARRRVAAEGEHPSTLAAAAGRSALTRAGLEPSGIDLLVFASASRDVLEPATAHIVQAILGTRAHAMDVANACNSFVNGIDVACAMITAGRARRALVVTGETPSRVVRRAPADRSQFRDAFAGYTFGDAGAAVVVETVDHGGILDVYTDTHSEYWSVGGVFGCGTRHPRDAEYTYFQADVCELGNAFEKVGVVVMDRIRHRTGLDWSDFRYILIHQFALPFLEWLVEKAGLPRERLVVTLPELGNMASASLGVQLDRIYQELRPGDQVLFIGLGGGVSVMTMVWER
ncbi:ketoacyl-ACP synthase III [Streptomyces morookaense]|uniref:3-oxoacyl-ACP synthase III family protein n=1 Tax=Streptomyces morookaense TaxID=1970 RepID=UPI00340E02F5